MGDKKDGVGGQENIERARQTPIKCLEMLHVVGRNRAHQACGDFSFATQAEGPLNVWKGSWCLYIRVRPMSR